MHWKSIHPPLCSFGNKKKKDCSMPIQVWIFRMILSKGPINEPACAYQQDHPSLPHGLLLFFTHLHDLPPVSTTSCHFCGESMLDVECFANVLSIEFIENVNHKKLHKLLNTWKVRRFSGHLSLCLEFRNVPSKPERLEPVHRNKELVRKRNLRII